MVRAPRWWAVALMLVCGSVLAEWECDGESVGLQIEIIDNLQGNIYAELAEIGSDYPVNIDRVERLLSLLETLQGEKGKLIIAENLCPEKS